LKTIFLVSCLIVLLGCNHTEKSVISRKIYFKKATPKTWAIYAETYSHDSLVLKSVWKVDYPIFHLDTVDLNNDGVCEIVVGVVKTTRWDKRLAKRLFIYKLYEGHIRPLWLGSKLAHQLDSFTIIRGQVPVILTFETDTLGHQLQSEYQLASFGLKWISDKIK